MKAIINLVGKVVDKTDDAGELAALIGVAGVVFFGGLGFLLWVVSEVF